MKVLLQLVYVLVKWSRGIRGSRGLIAVAALSSLASGIGYTLLIALIKKLLSDGLVIQTRLEWTFFALCVLIPVCGFVSQLLLLQLTSTAAYDLRIRLAHQILSAPLRLLERLGSHRLIATVSQDIASVVELVTLVPQTLTQFAMIAGCLVYLGWLSWKLLLVMLVYMLLGLLSHQLPVLRSFSYFALMRKQWDAMYKGLRGLMEGTKELKLNSRRRQAFFSSQLEPAAEGLRVYGLKGNAIAMAASNWGQILFFLFIGLLIFAVPSVISVGHAVLIGYALAVLFMITPMTMILNQIPKMGQAYVAAKRIEELGLSLDKTVAENLATLCSPLPPWRRLELIGVSHVYRHDGAGEDFELGPINLALEPGELVFLIGGNGSGKTTLIKLLMGLYEPVAGEIRLDGKPVTAAELDSYRQQFSVVFYDFYVFEQLLGLEATDLDTESNKYLDLLQLRHKVEIKDGILSTIDLSQGQRKRLALLSAYLEDRPIYVFDEWAADQDPMFKRTFYSELLPELKRRGKTVIVISHDDRFYGLADRIVKLESGKIEYDRRADAEGGEFGALAQMISSPTMI